MSNITISEPHFQASIMIALAIQYLFMTWLTSKNSSRPSTLLYLAISIPITFAVTYFGTIILPQLI